MSFGVNNMCVETKQQANQIACSSLSPIDSGSYQSCTANTDETITITSINLKDGSSTQQTLSTAYTECDPKLFDSFSFDTSIGATLFTFGLGTVITFFLISKKIGSIIKLIK